MGLRVLPAPEAVALAKAVGVRLPRKVGAVKEALLVKPMESLRGREDARKVERSLIR